MNIEQAPWCTEDWWVSHYDFMEEVRAGWQLPERVQFHDATLRNGEQTPGVVFSIEDKMTIARALDEAGIDRIEAGMPAVSPDDHQAVREITHMGLRARVMAFSRAVAEDVEKAIDCGVWGILLEVPAGLPRLKYQFGWTPAEVLKRSIDTIQYAKTRGLYVVFFPYDTSRAEMSVIQELIEGVTAKANPDAVAVVDTVGAALPEAVRYLVRQVRSVAGDRPVEFHTHNDFGLGVASSLAAVSAGAEVVHVSVNGLGERTGNAPLEETVISLKMLYGLAINVRLDCLVSLSRLVEELSGISVARNKPVVGATAFSRESGAGIDLLFSRPTVVMPVHPRVYGREMAVVLGKKSGWRSIQLKLQEWGLEATSAQLEQMRDLVKRQAIRKKSSLSDEEFRAIADQILNTLPPAHPCAAPKPQGNHPSADKPVEHPQSIPPRA
ncbi:MAG: LeuA family protein [Anaerolineae bacterium]